MKKIITTILLCYLALFIICGMISCGGECEHIYDDCDDTECNGCGEARESMHAWTEADCDSPKTCNVCNATEGEALGHEWTTPDVDLCKVQSTCSRCGATDGENVEHTWALASCENAKSCTECGATDGVPLGHISNADDGNCLTAVTCQRCPKIMTEAKLSHTQGAEDNNCETLAKCTICDFIIVPAKAHDFTGEWENDTEGHWHKCKNDDCSVTDEKSEHIPSDEDNNCETQVMCTACDFIIVPAKAHDFTGEWENDTEGHWHKCKNDDCSVTDEKSEHIPSDEDNNCETQVMCTACDFILVPAKAHDFTGEWKIDNEGHWHECKNEGCSVTDTKAGHSGGTASCIQGAICTDCKLEYTEKDANNHASDKYTYTSYGNTTHKKTRECCAVISEEMHIANTSKEITYTWSNNYASCTANGFCSLCEASVIEAVSSKDEEKRVSVAFTIIGFENQYFNKTTISFNTDDGSDIAPIIQLPGTSVTPPANPTKPGFTFTGWNKEIPTIMPSENVVITAIWTPATYTVTWVDDNGTVLERDEGLSYGETPTYNGEKPYKAATAEYSYLFTGWTPSVGPVSDNTTYTAVYEATKIEVLEGCSYKKGDVVICSRPQIDYCSSCGRLLNNYTVTITGLRGVLDGTPIYWVTYHCCGRKSSIIETEIIGKQ